VPILAAITIAGREAERVEIRRTSGYAHDVLARSETTSDQIAAGFRSLAGLRGANPCSPEALSVMRRVDLESSYIQAVGYVEGERIVCSSLGTDRDDLDIGPVDLVQPSGVKLRLNVRFPFAADVPFIVLEQNGFAAIIHKTLPIDATTSDDRVSLALVSTAGPTILTARGNIEAAWLDAIDAESGEAFVDATHVVSIAPSERFHIAAIAAEPVDLIRESATQTAIILVPIALAAAAVLIVAVLHLIRLQLAAPAVIRSALRRNEFFLVYQPVVALDTGRWVGAEALIRWRRADGEMPRPDLFIPIAEESGLIQRITRRVIELISRDAGGLFAAHPDFRLSLNLSPSDLHSPETVGLLRNLAEATGARPGNLLVEATERSFTDPARAGPVVDAIRGLGFRVAIDDFGTGYSSLRSLESLKVDYLKIDKSFIDSVGTQAATSHVILHIIEMARALGLELVAEGVEAEAQADFLRAHGVRFAQGFLFATPMRMDELLAGLARTPDAA
jgi:sensor c-di-GMP phosphodiesterase-like protein